MSKIGIKFNKGGKVYNCMTDIELNTDDLVVIETIRGLEVAIVCSPSGDKDTEEIKAVLRKATQEDIKKMEELKSQEKNVIDLTNKLIDKYKLEMKLVGASFTLDGTKVIINYVCEDRVDFRELVKDLASALKIRIELRQIGIRDQAKIVGGIGFCGKECCCKQYLNDFDKVSIKMAKTQGLSLNPSKISGICGRLMCCLAYENELYAELSQNMPKLNAKVKTKDGVGTVIYNNLLKSTVTVRVESDNEIKVNEYSIADVTILPRENFQPQSKKVSEDDFKKEQNGAENKGQKSSNAEEFEISEVDSNKKQKHFNKKGNKNKR